MDVIFEGSLSKSWSIKDVLQAVTEHDVPLSVLRIASRENETAGRLAITDGQFIVGACTDSGDQGYVAVRDILSIGDGSFTLMDSGNRHPNDLADTLHLSLARVIENLPALPEDPGTLFDQGSLLDKLFGGTEPAAIGDEPSSLDSASAPPPETVQLDAEEAVDAMEALIAKKHTGELDAVNDEPEAAASAFYETTDTISHATASIEENWNETPALRMALNAVIIISLLTSVIFGWPTFIKGIGSLRMHGGVETQPTGS